MNEFDGFHNTHPEHNPLVIWETLLKGCVPSLITVSSVISLKSISSKKLFMRGLMSVLYLNQRYRPSTENQTHILLSGSVQTVWHHSRHRREDNHTA